MTRTIHRLQVDAEIHLSADHDTLVVELRRTAIADFTLGLCLLKENLIEALQLGTPNSRTTIEFRRGEANHRAEGRATKTGMALRLSDTELSYWLRFFLKYVRDGTAEVDHLDVDLESADRATPNMFVLKVPDAVAPLTPEEARKRLGL